MASALQSSQPSHTCTCGGYQTCSCNSPCGIILQTANDEKCQMISLNDKLTAYISKIRNLKQSFTGISAESYYETVHVLEEEITHVKSMYEAELIRLRGLIEKANNEKSIAISAAQKLKVSINTEKERIVEETALVVSLKEELDLTYKALVSAQKETTDLKALLVIRERRIKEQEAETRRLERETTDLSAKLEAEVEIRVKAEGNVQCDVGAFAFDEIKLTQTVQDLEQRLRISNEIIANLEANISQISYTETTDIAALIAKLRECTNAELRRYQFESQEAFNHSLNALKLQIEEEVKTKYSIDKENTELETRIIQLTAQIHDLQAQLAASREQCTTLELAMKREHSTVQTRVETAERHTRELQQLMMIKMKECSVARDAQIALKTEIDAYKMLLDEEERRLANRPVAVPTCLPKMPALNKTPRVWKEALPRISTLDNAPPQPPIPGTYAATTNVVTPRSQRLTANYPARPRGDFRIGTRYSRNRDQGTIKCARPLQEVSFDE